MFSEFVRTRLVIAYRGFYVFDVFHGCQKLYSIHTCSARFLRHMLWTIQFGLVYFAQCNSQDIGTYDGKVLATHLQHMLQRVD